jgi:acyl dehydratase
MLIDPALIGTTSGPVEFDVEKGAIRRFAEAIGDENPLFLDSAYARAHGYANVLAPPTFPTTFRLPFPVRFEASRTLHGEQQFTYTRPLVAGETVRCASRLVDVYEKHGSLGAMTFIITETTGEDLEGNPVFMGRSVGILR